VCVQYGRSDEKTSLLPTQVAAARVEKSVEPLRVEGSSPSSSVATLKSAGSIVDLAAVWSVLLLQKTRPQVCARQRGFRGMVSPSNSNLRRQEQRLALDDGPRAGRCRRIAPSCAGGGTTAALPPTRARRSRRSARSEWDKSQQIPDRRRRAEAKQHERRARSRRPIQCTPLRIWSRCRGGRASYSRSRPPGSPEKRGRFSGHVSSMLRPSPRPCPRKERCTHIEAAADEGRREEDLFDCPGAIGRGRGEGVGQPGGRQCGSRGSAGHEYDSQHLSEGKRSVPRCATT
jgi:hypothetical protein